MKPVKVHVDAAYAGGLAGLAVVGNQDFGLHKRCVPAESSTHAEALAMAWAFELIAEQERPRAHFYTDCSTVTLILSRLRTTYHRASAPRGPRYMLDTLQPVANAQLATTGLVVFCVPRLSVQHAHTHARKALREARMPRSA